MTLAQIVAVVRRRWIALLIGVVVGLAAAAVTTAVLPRSYVSTTSLYVRATDTSQARTAYTSNLLTQQLVASYADLATSRRVLSTVVNDLRLHRSTDDLASHIDAEVQQDSTILTITVDDGSPEQAARIATAVSARLVAVVTQIEGTETQPAYTVSFATVDRPVVDSAPAAPRWPVNLTVGGVLGLLAGILLMVVLTALDRTVRTARDLAAAAGARALAAIPRERRASRDDFVLAGDSDAHVAAVRSLRTTVLLADADSVSMVLTFAGTRAGTGTSTVVRSLALASAHLYRVLLVEGDLRSPSMAIDLGLGATNGVTEVIRGGRPVSSVVRSWRGIDVLTAGAPVDDSTAALSGPELQQLAQRLRASYDLVLIDAPALGTSIDAVLLARVSDAIVLTGREGTTTVDEIAAAADALRAEQVRILGTVLTFATGPVDAVSTRAVSERAAPGGGGVLDLV